jgi:MFS family permease/quinol monooxygenase YgiN
MFAFLRTLSQQPAFLPLRGPVFRGLWLASFGANIGMWMNDVAASWLMTSLTTSPVMVAMVSTASTLPVFLLGLPSGALADIVDRRRYFAATQLWVFAVALTLAVLSLTDHITAPWLLALTFCNGIGLAMRWPVFSAIVPEVVPRDQLPAAMGLNGISMNLSRVVGPVVAGAILASLGSAVVFVLNAVLALLSFLLILRWKSSPRESALPGERFVGAMRVGYQHVKQSPRMRRVLWRIFMFFLQSTAFLSLLPLVARQVHGAGPGTFTLLLAAVGAGAVIGATQFPRWRARFNRDEFVLFGTLGHAAMSLLVIYVPELWVVIPATMVLGVAWLSTANSLTLAAQVALPNWVRARGMAIYQTALMGGAAAGSLLWGQVAGWSSVPTAITAAAVLGPLVLLATRRVSVEGGEDPDFSPASAGPLPGVDIEVDANDGPVMVAVEYQIDPSRADEFAAIMQKTRRARLRQGVLSWGLFRDTAVPGRYIEHFVDESWLEHQRRLERFTAMDAGLREQRLALHVLPEPPTVRRYVAEHMRPPEV